MTFLTRTVAERLVGNEMKAHWAVRALGEHETAWQHLERAHILSQSFIGLHLANHMAMLGYAIELRDWREVVGQVARLALAPLGALTGRIPIGNTGRSNVSVFQPMPIPDDLRRAIETAPE